MFQFTYKPRVTERVKAKSERHPRYNPERDGRGGIKGGCSTCYSLFDLHQARLSLDAAQREFLRRALPWTRIRLPRAESRPLKPTNHSCKAQVPELKGCVCSPAFRKKASNDVKNCASHLA